MSNIMSVNTREEIQGLIESGNISKEALQVARIYEKVIGDLRPALYVLRELSSTVPQYKYAQELIDKVTPLFHGLKSL